MIPLGAAQGKGTNPHGTLEGRIPSRPLARLIRIKTTLDLNGITPPVLVGSNNWLPCLHFAANENAPARQIIPKLMW